MKIVLSKASPILVWAITAITIAASASDSIAGSFQLNWLDQSTNETGFRIERKSGITGTYAVIANVGANVVAYTDLNVAGNTTYCYRVNAYNSTGNSPYSPEACGTSPATTTTTYSLTLAKVGNGTVTSNPAGITCGTTCANNFTSGAIVTLSAVPASGYTFTGWTGTAEDCTDGSLTMNANKACTANFTASTTPTGSYILSTKAVSILTDAGAGSGKVIASTVGIDCGLKCSANVAAGGMVTLQAMPAVGSMFAGWSGDADCSDGNVTMSTNKTCTASFKLVSFYLTITRIGTGSGTVTSNIAGINCGSSCGSLYAKDTNVKLIATPAAGSTFAGWSGNTNCVDGSVTMTVTQTCTATFTRQTGGDHIGLFRPSTGSWFLISNNLGNWQGCEIDHCITQFGNKGDRPVTGDWNGDGASQVGIYDPSAKAWELDANSNDSWQGCSTDFCANFTIATNSEGEVPITGRWPGLTKDGLGLFQLVRTSTDGARRSNSVGTRISTTVAGYWYLDKNGNGKFDGCSADQCFGPFGKSGDLPVVGDWNGSGASKIGVFSPESGMWMLDANNNGKVDGCTIDKCFGPFGVSGDLPVTGDWNSTGTTKIGVFRATTGEWFLDVNNNGKWDGCSVDRCVAGFGQAGDLPVVGKW